MNVTQLIKKLTKIAEKNPRADVYVEAEYFISEDYSHGLVNSVSHELLNMSDGDGFTIENKDGSEHQKMSVILHGK